MAFHSGIRQISQTPHRSYLKRSVISMGEPAHQGIGAVDPKSDNGTSVRLLRS
jgi:hypothetical protein